MMSERFDGLPDSNDLTAWAALIRASLELGEPCVFNYEPGNATRYQLVFTPLAEAQGDDLTGVNPSTFVLVSYIDHGAYPFRLLDRDAWSIDVGYVMEKFRVNAATAEPLADLFAAVLDKTPVPSSPEVTEGQLYGAAAMARDAWKRAADGSAPPGRVHELENLLRAQHDRLMGAAMRAEQAGDKITAAELTKEARLLWEKVCMCDPIGPGMHEQGCGLAGASGTAAGVSQGDGS